MVSMEPTIITAASLERKIAAPGFLPPCPTTHVRGSYNKLLSFFCFSNGYIHAVRKVPGRRKRLLDIKGASSQPQRPGHLYNSSFTGSIRCTIPRPTNPMYLPKLITLPLLLCFHERRDSPWTKPGFLDIHGHHLFAEVFRLIFNCSANIDASPIDKNIDLTEGLIAAFAIASVCCTSVTSAQNEDSFRP